MCQEPCFTDTEEFEVNEFSILPELGRGGVGQELLMALLHN